MIHNANILDALLANLHLLPKDWKQDENGDTRFIFFWGTIYRGWRGNLCVRYLYFCDGRWLSDYFWFDDNWFGTYSAALRAS